MLLLFGVVNVFVGLLNLLPLPPFDGGHLTVLAIEKIRGRPVDMRKVIPVSAAVAAFFIVFTVAVVYVDLVKPPSRSFLRRTRSGIPPERGAATISQHGPRGPPRPCGYDGPVTEQTVLVVDDETAIAEAVRARLSSEGFRVLVAADGPQALELASAEEPDLVVLDLMLPGMDGLEVCRRLQAGRWVPVLMLTARTEEADKVAGFAVGADDYLTKPFSLRELTVRVRAILRRVERITSPPATEPIDHGGLSVDPAKRKVSVDGEEVQLTPLEFEILLALAREPGVVLSRELLMDRVWGYRDYAGGRVVDSHVARIRRKLGEDGAEPRFVRTVHGVGYAFGNE